MMTQGLAQTKSSFAPSEKALSFFEFWPAWLFYLPVYIYVIYLMIRYLSIMLPTAANPKLANGQFVGESKFEILNLVSECLPEYSVNYLLVNKKTQLTDTFLLEVRQKLVQHQISYPFVAKPDLGCRGAGVNLIQSEEALTDYLHQFPVGQSLVCQELIPYESEAGIFYCRLPHQEKGEIISLTLKYFPQVIGDGVSTLKTLIEQDARASQLTQIYFPRFKDKLSSVPARGEKIKLVFAGNHSKGAIFKDGRNHVNQALSDTFDRISKKLPEFYFGRFDIRFESFEALEHGRNFKIVEINGASAESTHIWDANYSLLNAWRDLFKQFHWAFMIGHYNRNRGFKTERFQDFYQAYKRDKHLNKLYPGTH